MAFFLMIARRVLKCSFTTICTDFTVYNGIISLISHFGDRLLYIVLLYITMPYALCLMILCTSNVKCTRVDV